MDRRTHQPRDPDRAAAGLALLIPAAVALLLGAWVVAVILGVPAVLVCAAAD